MASDTLLLDIQKAAGNPQRLQRLIAKLRKRGTAHGLKRPAPMATLKERSHG
jgi:hypothetical protein